MSKIENNSKLAKAYVTICIVCSLWGFIADHTIYYNGNLFVYLMALAYSMGFALCLFKYGVNLKGTRAVGTIWLLFFIYTYIQFLWHFQIQWLTFWLPPLAFLLIASHVKIRSLIPYRFLIFSAFLALIGILFQILLPNMYNSSIAPIFMINKSGISALDWVEEGHGYAGFTYQLGVTSIILTYGIAALFSFREDFMKRRKPVVVYLGLALLVIGVFLSGKRTMSVIDVLVPFFLIMLHPKYRKWLLTLPVLALLFYSAYEWFVSHASTLADAPIVGRLVQTYVDNKYGDNIFDTREGLYLSALAAWQDNPLWGIGDFKAYTGMDTDVHNSYLQVLCERGVVGFVLFVGGLLFTLLKTINLYLKRQLGKLNPYIQYSLFIQLVYIFYAFTGNVTIDLSCYLMYFTAVAILLDVIVHKNINFPKFQNQRTLV